MKSSNFSTLIDTISIESMARFVLESNYFRQIIDTMLREKK